MKCLWLLICTSLLQIACSKDSTEDSQKPDLVFPNDIAERISDPAFLRYCYLNWDTNKDGTISKSEVIVVTSVDCSGQGIKSLSGIEYLQNLTELDCSDNDLESLDCRYNEQLTSLNFKRNRLSKIDLSGNTLLLELNCEENLLKTLNISLNPVLTSLKVNHNPLEKLNFGEHIHVLSGYTRPDVSRPDYPFIQPEFSYAGVASEYYIDLYVDTHSLTVIAPAAVRMYVTGTVENLTLEDCSALRWLECDNVGLKTLNCKSATELSYVSCTENQLKHLDLTGKKQLRYLNCKGSPLESLSVENKLTHLACDGAVGVVDVDKFTDLTHLSCSDVRLKSSDFSALQDLEYLSYKNCADKTLNISENEKLKVLNISGASALGICDLSKLKALTWFGCVGCGIKSLMLPTTTSLILDCSGNELECLDASMIGSLQLMAPGNKITSFILGEAVDARYQYCFRQTSDNLKITSRLYDAKYSYIRLESSLKILDLSECFGRCGFELPSSLEMTFGGNPALNLEFQIISGSASLKVSGSAMTQLPIFRNYATGSLSFRRLDLSECPSLISIGGNNFSVNILILKEGQQIPSGIHADRIEYC